MGIATTLGADCRAIDGTETITFTARRASGNTSITVSYVDSHEVTTREAFQSEGFYQQGDTRFLLYASQLSSYTPQPGDEITDSASVRWELLDVNTDDLAVAYDCTARKARASSSPAPTQPSASGTVSAGADQTTATNGTASTFAIGAILAINSSSQAILADADDGTKSAVGLGTTGAAAGTTETITMSGAFALDDWTSVIGATSLTPNAVYFLSTTGGQMTTTAPSSVGNVVQRLGIALSATKFKIEIEEPIVL